MTALLRITEALSRPLLFHPTKLEVILSALNGRLPDLEVAASGPEASRFMGRADGGRPYRAADGIAFIPIVGSLANRGAYIGASSGVVSYEGIAMQVRHAAADPSVHSIVLDIDSGGGEATGMFRLTEVLRQARASKRLVAFVDDMAASAAYGIASQAHEIMVSPTSIVGSIGVVLAHVDRSAEMEKLGRKVTLIHAGANKVDGNPFAALSEAVRADLQAEVLAFHAQFLATVAAGRPSLSIEKARATEAKTFIGQAAIDAGLADRIDTLEGVISGLRTRASARPSPQPTGNVSMDIQAQINAARAEGRAEGRLAERERIAAIINSDGGKLNPASALAIALDASLADAPAAGIANMLKIGAQSTAPAGRPNGLRLAAEDLVRREAGLPPLPRSSSKPKSGLLLAVEAMVAEDARRAGVPDRAPRQAFQSSGSGLKAAVAEMVARDARWP